MPGILNGVHNHFIFHARELALVGLLPIKPAPPVTKIFFILLLYFIYSSIIDLIIFQRHIRAIVSYIPSPSWRISQIPHLSDLSVIHS